MFINFFLSILCQKKVKFAKPCMLNTDKSNRIFKGKRWKKREDERSDPNRAQWKGKDRLVLDPEKIGSAHLWVDKHLSPQESPMMSNQLAAALREAELTHVGLREIEEG